MYLSSTPKLSLRYPYQTALPFAIPSITKTNRMVDFAFSVLKIPFLRYPRIALSIFDDRLAQILYLSRSIDLSSHGTLQLLRICLVCRKEQEVTSMAHVIAFRYSCRTPWNNFETCFGFYTPCKYQ